MADINSKLSNLTPEQRALLLKKLGKAPAAASSVPTIRPREKGEQRVLSYAQEQMWFVDQLTPGASAYSVPYPVKLIGPVNVPALERALHGLVGRHQVLRTMFPALRGAPVPLVAKEWSCPIARVDARGWPDEQLRETLRLDAARPFHQARDLKLRASLYQVGDDEYIFLHNSHHIAWDLRSRGIFYADLEAFYAAALEDREPDLPPLPFQYSDFAAWQRRYLTGDTLTALTTYWREKLAGVPPHITLPTDKPRPPRQDLQGSKLPFALTADEIQRARAVAKENGVSLYVVLLSAFQIFLASQSGQNDILVGTPFDGRQPEMEPTIGMFINTLVMRAELSEDLSYRDILPRVRETVQGGLGHQELPFEKIVEAARPPRDLSRMVLFQVNFRLQDGVPPLLRLAGLRTEYMPLIDTSASKFDLALELNSVAESKGYFEYSTSLFEEATVLRMASDFRALLGEMLTNPTAPLESVRAFRRARAALG